MGMLEGVLFCDGCSQTLALNKAFYLTGAAPPVWLCHSCRGRAAEAFSILYCCPKCGQILCYPQPLAGKDQRCPRCEDLFKVPFELPCPQCGSHLLMAPSKCGHRVKCPKCGRSARVPGPLLGALSEMRSTPVPAPGVPGQGDRLWYFFATVVGVTHENAAGTDRQTILAECEPLEQLQLEREEDNPHDPNAVKVCRQNGDQLGYLPAGLAAVTARRMDDGYGYTAFFMNLLGGTADKPTLGARLAILVAEPDVSDEEAQDYLDAITPALRHDAE